MAKVKINDGEFTEIETNITKAMEVLEETMEIWGTNFDNLYHNFVTSGFLDDLYNDAISNYHTWSRGLSAVSNVVSGAALGLAIGGWVGGIIGLVIGAIFGVYQFCKGDPEWITVSRDVFKQMLENCCYGVDDSYIYMNNTLTKLFNCQIALQRVRTCINDFNQAGANFEKAADQYDLSLRTGGADDLTILGVETEVVIDGKTITMDTSEAMSAFYTYAYTVTSSVIAADYLQREYGYDIDFLDLVAGVNSFMADTIQSDLYTPEMINVLLPQYVPSEQAAYDAATAATGLTQEELAAALGSVAAIGANPLFAGLVGAGVIGKISGKDDGKDEDKKEDPPSNVCPVCGKDPCKCGSSDSYTDGYNPNPDTDSDTDSDTDPENDIKVEDIIDTKVPIEEDITIDLGVVTEDGKVDYDKLAYEEYQFDKEGGVAAIEAERLKIMDEIEAKYAAGEFSDITKQLQDYGYETVEIATILASKSMTIKAVVDGYTRSQLATRAAEMAKADGVNDYKSKYTENPTTDQLADDTKPLRTLHVNSDNKELVEMEANIDKLEEAYKTKVEDANKLLDEAKVDKEAVDALKEKYEAKYGNDTTKWEEDAAKEYATAVEKYNDSAEKANEAIEVANKAKEELHTSREAFDKACEEYYQSKVVQDETQTEQVVTDGSSTTTDPGTSGPNSVVTEESTVTEGTTVTVGDGEGVTINGDGTVSVGGSTGSTETGSTDTGSSSTDTGFTLNEDGTISVGGSANNTVSEGTTVVTDTSTTQTTTQTITQTNTGSTGPQFIDQDTFLAALNLKSNEKDKK